MAEPRAIQIELAGVSKFYGPVPGVAETDLAVFEGEFFSLLGPSGCGKSTLLRLIAGFETPDSGRILVGGRDMTRIPPERRRIGFVFQNYALFPHMTVFENVAFGLRARGSADIVTKVGAALALVELDDLAARRPAELSGGQQQRVALARAIAIEPDVLLLDEPLAALDKQLRQSMQRKLVELHRALRITTIFVTHDQEEALTMSDRLAVMNARTHRVEQMGSPKDIYRRPASRMVSAFLGHSNVVEDRVASVEPDGSFRTALGLFGRDGALEAGSVAAFTLRPERIRICAGAGAGAGDGEGPSLDAEVRDAVFMGDGQMYYVETQAGVTLKVRTLDDGGAEFSPGDRVRLRWAPEALRRLAGAPAGE